MQYLPLRGIERDCKNGSDKERLAALQNRSAPVPEQLKRWLDKALPNTLPQTAMGNAVSYLASNRSRLGRYVEGGHLPLDNNRAKNALLQFVIGRKNWMFSDTPQGATASAQVYSLIETAQANGRESYA